MIIGATTSSFSGLGRVCTILSLILLFSTTTHATVRALTWKNSIDLATRNNAELRQGQASFESTQYLEGSARSGFFPQVTGTLGGSQGNTTSSSSLTDSGSTKTTYTASLSGTQNLFSGFQDAGKVSQAKANTEASRAALEITKAKVSFELKSGYQTVMYAQEYFRLTSDIIQRRESDAKLVNLQFQSGRENKGSVLLSKAYLLQAQYESLQAKNSLDSTQAQLRKLLGQDDTVTFDLKDSIPLNEPGENKPNFEKLALSTPDHKQAFAQEDSADSGITVARSTFFPSLSLTGTVGKQSGDFPPQNDRWTVGLNLTVPFFSGGKDYYGLRSAAASWSAAVENRSNVDRDLLARLRQAYYGFVEAVTKFKVDEAFKDAAQLRAEIARKKYNNGLLTFEDWDQIENDYITRQKAYLQTKRDRVIAEATWEQALGRGVIP